MLRWTWALLNLTYSPPYSIYLLMSQANSKPDLDIYCQGGLVLHRNNLDVISGDFDLD